METLESHLETQLTLSEHPTQEQCSPASLASGECHQAP